MEVILDKNQIWVIFSFEFKTGCKAAEITSKSTTHLAQELLTNIQCSGDLSFAKETIALKMRSAVAGHQKVTVMN